MAHGTKTWIPKLIQLMETFCKYVGRWRYKLEHFLTPTQMALLDLAVTACNEFVTSVTEES